MEDNRTRYEKSVQDRSTLRYYLGLIIRWKQNRKYARARRIARKRGATIGEGVIMPLSLARRANSNLIVGNHTSIQTDKLDQRSPIQIGNHVIIGSGNEIIITSHNFDFPDWVPKKLRDSDRRLCMVSTNILIPPSCRVFGYGAMVNSGSVFVKAVEAMSVVGGNPIKKFKKESVCTVI